MKCLLKRIAPFFITLAVGLFVASFFVSIALPNFQINRGSRWRHREYDRQLRIEVQQLREENLRLKQRNSEVRIINIERPNIDSRNDVDLMVPPPPPMPVAPREVR